MLRRRSINERSPWLSYYLRDFFFKTESFFVLYAGTELDSNLLQFSPSASQALSGVSHSTWRLGFDFFVVVIGGSGGLGCLLLHFKQHWKTVSLPELFLLFRKIRVEGFGCGLWVIGSFASFSLTSLVVLANFFIDLGSGSLTTGWGEQHLCS